MSDFSWVDDLPTEQDPKQSNTEYTKLIATKVIEHAISGKELLFEGLLDESAEYVANLCGPGHFGFHPMLSNARPADFGKERKPIGIKLCVENVKIALGKLAKSEIDEALGDLTRQGFFEICKQLPSAR